MTMIKTERLLIRRFTKEDAAFILNLLNDPDWINYIGDKGIKTIEDAEEYIKNSIIKMYDELGFGLYLVALKGSGTPMGMCGLVKRDGLKDVDLGFAFLSDYTGKGYGNESARAVMIYAKEELRLNRLAAITTPSNKASEKLLLKIGFQFDSLTKLFQDADPIKLFIREL
ncbi:GNAT family N-acetyltransferase [Virgibacillus dakarensis]|nr:MULTISPECIES: GNAT family N-acetyltransferase [Bacillaceae]MBT2218486.1 GNAT family N-acetyltransferase [Virgibacillus dakarensis]